jgi:hypothetical protein
MCEMHRAAGREEQVLALIRTILIFVASSRSASSIEDVVALTHPSHVSRSKITKGSITELILSMSCKCQQHVGLRLGARRWDCQVVVDFSRIKCTSMFSEIGCIVSRRKRASRMHALGLVRGKTGAPFDVENVESVERRTLREVSR